MPRGQTHFLFGLSERSVRRAGVFWIGTTAGNATCPECVERWAVRSVSSTMGSSRSTIPSNTAARAGERLAYDFSKHHLRLPLWRGCKALAQRLGVSAARNGGQMASTAAMGNGADQNPCKVGDAAATI